MGRPFRVFLNSEKVYVCHICQSHLASADDLLSKQFHAKSGRAYLFAESFNVLTSPHEEREMTTGVHVVCDLFCMECMSYVGWKYISAREKSQKYKEGKSILERSCMVERSWRFSPEPSSLLASPCDASMVSGMVSMLHSTDSPSEEDGV